MSTTAPSLSSLFVRYARPLWPRLVLLTAFVVVGIGLRLVGPHLVRFVIDGAVSGRSLAALSAASGAFLAVTMSGVVVAGATAYAAAEVGWRSTNRLRRDLLSTVLAHDLAFHESRTPGELIERVDADPAGLARFFTGFVVAAMTNGLFLVSALIVLYRERWWLGLGLAVFAVAMIVILGRLRSVAAPRYRDSRLATTSQMSFVTDRLRGVEDIRANAAADYVMPRFVETAVAAYRAARRARVTGDALGATGSVLLRVGSLGALTSGVFLYLRGEATVGTVYLIVQYASMLSGPLRGVSGQADELQRAKVSAERVLETLGPESSEDGGDQSTLPAGPLSVELSDVWFSYGAEPPVLRGVTFRLAAGEVAAVVGRTGAGKSTLARALLRLGTVSSGSILLGGVDVAHTAFAHFRSRVAFVPQQVQLFHGTLRDNLALFDRTIPDTALLDVVDSLGLGSWFERLRDGLSTIVDANGSDGIGMSGGEAQLVAMARVFLADPGLVVLDEATSRLDPLTERALDVAMTRLLAGRTAIVIAHRPSTVRRVGTVLVVDDGVIAEQGHPGALEKDPSSRLASLLRSDAQL